MTPRAAGSRQLIADAFWRLFNRPAVISLLRQLAAGIRTLPLRSVKLTISSRCPIETPPLAK